MKFKSPFDDTAFSEKFYTTVPYLIQETSKLVASGAAAISPEPLRPQIKGKLLDAGESVATACAITLTMPMLVGGFTYMILEDWYLNRTSRTLHTADTDDRGEA